MNCSIVNRDTNEPKIFYKTDSGLVTTSLKEAYANSTNTYDIGFINSKNEFNTRGTLPMYPKTEVKGAIQSYIGNGYLEPNQIDGKFRAVDSYAAELIYRDLVDNNYGEFQRNGLEFELKKFDMSELKDAPLDMKVATDIASEIFGRNTESKDVIYDKSTLIGLISGFLEKVGFKTSSIEEYNYRFKNKYGVDPDATALIDFANKIIAFKNGEIGVEDFSEEFSHLVVEGWNQEEISRMLDVVQNTSHYARYADIYRNIYGKEVSDPVQLERVVRKEILGKMLSEALQKNFTAQNTTESDANIFRKLIQIFRDTLNTILNRITPQDESDVDRFAKDVLNHLYNDTLSDVVDTNVKSEVERMFSTGNIKIDEKIKKYMERLSGGGFVTSKSKDNDVVRESVSAFNQVGTLAYNYLELLKKDPDNIEPRLRVHIENLIGTRQALLGMSNFVKSEQKLLDPKYAGAIQDAAKDAMSKLDDLEGAYVNKQSKSADDIAVKVAEKYGKEGDDRVMKGLVEKAKQMMRDTNWFIRKFGQTSKTSSPFVSALNLIIENMHNLASQNTWRDARKYFTDLLKPEVQRIIGNFKDGKYWKSSVDSRKLERDIKEYELETLKLAIPEAYKDVTLDDYIVNGSKMDKPVDHEALRYDYYYKKNSIGKPFISKEQQEYNANFIEKLDRVTEIEPWSTSFYQYLTNMSKNRRDGFDTIKERRRLSSPFDSSGELKTGLTLVRYSKLPSNVNPYMVVPMSSFKSIENGTIEADDWVVLGDDSQMSTEGDARLALNLMRWDNINFNSEKLQKINPKSNFIDAYRNKKIELRGQPQSVIQSELSKWLLENSMFEVSQEYFKDQKTDYINYDKLFDTPTGRNAYVKINEYKDDIDRLQLEKRSLLKIYKSTNDYKEIDVDSMSINDKNRIIKIEEEQRSKRELLLEYFKQAGVDMYSVKDNTPELNQSFYRGFEDVTGKRYSNATVDDIREYMKTQYDTPVRQVKFEKFVKDLQKSKSSKEYVTYKDMALRSGLTSSDVDVLTMYIRDNAPVWFRRFDVDNNYQRLIEDLNNGAVDIDSLMSEYENSDDDILTYNGTPLNMMKLTPRFKFTLPDRTDINDLYDEYLNTKDNTRKYDLIHRMAGADNLDSKYMREKAYTNDFELETYIKIMDTHLDNLSKFKNIRPQYIFHFPQVRKTELERKVDFASKGNKLKQFVEYMKESVRYTEDEHQDAYLGKTIPKYGFYEIADEDLTTDVLYALMWHTEQANLYEQRVNHSNDALALIESHDSVNYYKGKDPKTTNYYEMMKDMVDFNFYNKSVTHKIEVEIPILGQKIDFAKVLFAFKSISVKFALAFSPIVALTNLTSGTTQNALMSLTGRDVYSPSNRRAMSYLTPMVGASLSDVGSFNPQSRLNNLMYSFGIYNITERYKNAKFNKAARLLPELSFGMMAAGNFLMEGNVLLSKLMETRLIDGRFRSWREYSTSTKLTNPDMSDAEIKSNFEAESKKSMYDYLDDKGEFDMTRLEADGYEGDINRDKSTAMSAIKSIAEQTTMEIASYHEGSAARDPGWSFVLSLKKWMVMANSVMFSRDRYDFQRGGTETGLMNTPFSVLRLFKAMRNDSQSFKEAYENLDEHERKNIKYSMMTTAAITMMMGLAMMLKKAADDDDDNENYLLQLSAYMMLRNLNETFSGNIGIGNSVYEALQSPIMTASTLGNLANIANFNDMGKTVSSGKYEGMNKWVSSLTKLTWGKNLYTISSANTLADTRKSYEFFNTKNAFYHVFSLIPDKDKSDE